MREPVARICRVTDVPAGAAPLTTVEVRRWERLVQQADRDAYLAAHVLVRQVVAELTGVAPDEVVLVQSCPTCGATDHGRPAVAGRPDVHVSLSHTRGVVAAIAAATPCGIDVEAHHAGGVPVGSLTPREQAWVAAQPAPGVAFTRLWARKEAWAKATGEGLDSAVRKDVLDADWLTGELLAEAYAAAWVVL